MEKFKAWYLLAIIIMFSCNIDFSGEKERMIKGLSGVYIIDTAQSNYSALKAIGIKNLDLILDKDGNYRFSPAYPVLNGYEGTWTLSDDDEFSNFIFNCKNGKREENRILSISFIHVGKDYIVYFTDKNKK